MFGSAQTITLALGELRIESGVTINGPGQELLTIDANQQSRVLNVEPSVGGPDDFDVTLSGLTLTGGTTTGDNEFLDNFTLETTHSGGGIRFLPSGELTLTGSRLSGNHTNGGFAQGGGIFTSSGTVTLRGSTLSDNHTQGDFALGGGIHAHSGDVWLSGSTLSGNHTRGYLAQGGGIHTDIGSVTLTRSTLSGNHTQGDYSNGGGINSRNVTVSGSTLSDNRTEGENANGGGLWFAGELTIVGSTVTGNVATSEGGGLSHYANADKRLTIYNSIIAGNRDNGTAPDFLAPINPETNLDVKSSLIGDTTGTSLTTATDGNVLDVDWKTVLTNNGTDPTLSDNGGPTETVALIDSPTNPALDAGDEELLIRGQFRLVTPTDVVSSTSATDIFDASGLLDSNILTSENFASTTNTGDLWATNDPNGFPGDYFDATVTNPAPDPVLVFSLSEVQSLTHIAIWGYDSIPTAINNDVRSFTLEFSNDGGTTYSDTIALTKPRVDDAPVHMLPFNRAIPANSVRVTITDNYFGFPGFDSGDRVGLDEVRFLTVDPDFDQRGIGFPRVIDGDGDGEARIDIGAFEAPEADVMAPVITAPSNIDVEADSAAGTDASDAAIVNFLDAFIVTDDKDLDPSISNDAPSIFPLGNTFVTVTATDAAGNQSTATATVTVVDTTAPRADSSGSDFDRGEQ